MSHTLPFLLRVLDDGQKIVERIDFTASGECRQIEVHGDRIGPGVLVNDIQDFTSNPAALFLQRAHRSVDRVSDAGAWRQLQGLEHRARCRVEWLYAQPDARESVASEHARAAAIAEKRNQARRLG